MSSPELMLEILLIRVCGACVEVGSDLVEAVSRPEAAIVAEAYGKNMEYRYDKNNAS